MGKINAEKTIEFLNTRWNGAACPLCGGTEWTVTDKSFELIHSSFNTCDMFKMW